MLVGYLRVSTAQQVNNGDSLALQRMKIEGWSTYQGLEKPTITEDAGISGCTVDDRPGLKGALRTVLDGASKGHKPTLICASLDRLGRSMVDSLEVAEVLEDAGVRLVTLDGIDTGSTMGKQSLKAILTVKAMVAEMERDAIVSRMQGGRAHAKSQGRIYTCCAPYGKHPVGQSKRGGNRGLSIEEDEMEQNVIARIKELRESGMSYRDIQHTLAIEGLNPRKGKRWSLSMLHSIVTGKKSVSAKKPSARVARARAALMCDSK